jgi:ammonium transporter Rh
VGFNYLLAAFAFQWGILVVGFWDFVWATQGDLVNWEKIPLSLESLIQGDYAAACCMIAFGALLGKVDLFQAWIVVFIQIIFYGLNRAICLKSFFSVDVGGTMYVHTFGAYFGLGASWFLQSKKASDKHDEKVAGGYMNSTIAMVGTIFLYLYWPSFNAVWAHPETQVRVIGNTALAISASCIGACVFARFVSMKLDMEVLLNSSLAGGVAIGACCNNLVAPGIAVGIGAFAGFVSAYSRAYVTPRLQKWGFHDTCGVHDLHGVPGIIGAIASAVTTANADWIFKKGGYKLEYVFGGWMADRGFNGQGATQIYALLVSIFIGIGTGAFAGLVASWVGRTPSLLFEDTEHWENVQIEHAFVNKVYSEKAEDTKNNE